MGKLYSLPLKRLNRFNIDNRAEKVILREKPKPAPRHPATLKHMNEIISASEAFQNERMVKNEQLNEYLKQVYIKSTDVTPEETITSKRPLPLERKQVEDFEFGFYEPSVIPEGKCTLKQAMNFLAQHQSDPKMFTAAAIAKEYKLSEEKVEKVLEYYKTFLVYIPEKKPTSKEKLFKNIKLKTSNLLESETAK